MDVEQPSKGSSIDAVENVTVNDNWTLYDIEVISQTMNSHRKFSRGNPGTSLCRYGGR